MAGSEIYTLRNHLVVSLPTIVKVRMRCLYVNFPSLCLEPPYHPSSAETYPETPHFPLSMLFADLESVSFYVNKRFFWASGLAGIVAQL